jgi:tRNA-Thr(GGU) m(6)t(6)A37 methyltransferase TsaA
MAYTLAQIAHIETDFSEKFGIPRQSGLVEELRARIVFEPEFRSPDAVRGLDGYDYIWLVWQFSTVVQAGQDGTNWRPTVRPPRLGGNTRMGVFATRSPFRPNALGLSSVKLLKVEPNTPQGPVLTVGGADLLDGTPIFDIKPYLPYVDAHPDARGGFTDTTKFYTLQVQAEPEVLEQIPADKRDALLGVLRSDPRPSYQHDPERLYGLSFGGVEVKFKVDGDVLTVSMSRLSKRVISSKSNLPSDKLPRMVLPLVAPRSTAKKYFFCSIFTFVDWHTTLFAHGVVYVIIFVISHSEKRREVALWV